MNNEFTAKTVEDAINEGVKALGITKEAAEWVVLEEPTRGIFGIGAKPAKVIVTKKKTDVDLTVDFLEGLFAAMKLTATTEVSLISDEKVVINLITTDSSQVIGYRGEVLDSIQALASAVYNSGKETYKRLVIDCEGYREKREGILKGLALKLAAKAVKTGRKVVLEPMNPFERRIIHSTLVDFEGIKTASEGKEPNRYIAIIPDGYVPAKRGDKYGKRDNRGGKERSKKDGFKDQRRRQPSDQKPREKAAKPAFGGAVFLGNSLKNQKTDEE
ncbi:MAG: protein jag [Clostridia bacterium]|nr:protein jag [Clostridia bacterium]MBR7135974.1 protein jag [Clostridia bacterium]